MKSNVFPALIFVFSLVLGGCASHETRALSPNRVDAYRIKVNEAGVVIAADPFDNKQKVEGAFTVDLNEQGYVPILLVMENTTADNFQVLKGDIELIDTSGNVRKPVIANIMVEKFEHNKIAYALLGFGIFSYMSAEEANKKMLRDWSTKELPAEKILIPNRKTYGVVYFDVGPGLGTFPGSTLQVPVVNLRTGERHTAKLKMKPTR